MTDTYALSARPSNCAIAWATKDALFVEIACKDGPPLIVRYRLSIEGLAQALNVLVEHNEAITRNIQQPEHPKVRVARRTVKAASAQNFTDEQRAHVQSVLRRLKIT